MAPSAPEAWLKSMGLRDASPTADREDTSEAMSLGLYHAQCKDLAQPPTAVRHHSALRPHTHACCCSQRPTAYGCSQRPASSYAQAGLQRFLTSLQAQASNDDRKVSLRGLQLGSRAGPVLARSLSPGVTALDLHGNGSLGEAGALALLPLLDGGTLRSLDLGGCGVGGEFAPVLAQSLLRAPHPMGKGSTGLRMLQLGGAAQGLARPNRLVGVGQLMAALQQCCAGLEVLGLSYCHLGEEQDGGHSSAAALASLLVAAPRLHTLEAGGNGLGGKVLRVVLEALPRCASLRELELESNGLTDADAALLAAALEEGPPEGDAMTALDRAKLSRRRGGTAAGGTAAGGHRCAALRALKLGGNRIGVAGAAALARALGANRSLGTLSLADNRLGDAGGAAMAGALRHNMTLTTLHLGGCGLGPEGAAALAAALISSNGLQQLRLCRNPLGEEGATPLAAALTRNHGLRSLDLTATRLGDGAALRLGVALPLNHGLRCLRLDDNRLSDAGGVELLRRLTASGAAAAGGGGGGGGLLCELGLTGNGLSLRTVAALQRQCEANAAHCAQPWGLRRRVMALEPTEPALIRTTATLRTEAARNEAALRRVAQLEAQLAEARGTAEARAAATAEQLARHGEARREAMAQLEAVTAEQAAAEAEAEATRSLLGPKLERLRAREEALVQELMRREGGGGGGGEGSGGGGRGGGSGGGARGGGGGAPPSAAQAALMSSKELVSQLAALERRVTEQHARRQRAARLGAWVEQQLAKLEGDAATKASLKASSGQRRSPTSSPTK